MPSPRDKNGHLIQWPGRIAYLHDNVRVVYHSTVDARHEFWLERIEIVNLGAVSFAEARIKAIELANQEKRHAE